MARFVCQERRRQKDSREPRVRGIGVLKELSVGRRFSLIGALATAALMNLLAAWPASAALFVILEPTSGPPGTEVRGRTGGEGAFSTPVDPLPTFLVAEKVADSVTSPDDRGLIEIGRLVVDAAGNGQISFRVPQIEPGDYVVMVFCPSCAPFSAGRTMAAVADFGVTALPPPTDTVPVDTAGRSALIAVVTVLLLVAGSFIALRRRLAH